MEEGAEMNTSLIGRKYEMNTSLVGKRGSNTCFGLGGPRPGPLDKGV